MENSCPQNYTYQVERVTIKPLSFIIHDEYCITKTAFKENVTQIDNDGATNKAKNDILAIEDILFQLI